MGGETAATRTLPLVLLLLGLFALRVYYGLSIELRSGDSVQIYLLGLKFFTTGEWPFFGPDEVRTQRQIAGALQGLVVGLPIFVARTPEAPAMLVNALSFTGLVLFGRYLTRRFALVPSWITYTWLLTLPWTLNISTHAYNPSYLLLPSCLFFVGFLELTPSLGARLVTPGAAMFLMGLGIAAANQFHLSWPLLGPFLLLSLLTQARAGVLTAGRIGWLVAGAALPLALLVPTVATYGVSSLFGALGANATGVNVENLPRIAAILPRFLSFASYQIPRFIAGSSDARWEILTQNPWLIPLVVSLSLVGLAQPVLMLIVLFRPTLLGVQGDPCRDVRRLLIGTVLLMSVVFLFTARPPLTRNYYILSPVALLTGYVALGALVQGPRGRRWALAILLLAVVCQIGLATRRFADHPWTERRALVSRAISERNYEIVAKRRPHARY